MITIKRIKGASAAITIKITFYMGATSVTASVAYYNYWAIPTIIIHDTARLSLVYLSPEVANFN